MEQKLNEFLDKANLLLAESISSETVLKEWRGKRNTWADFVSHFLRSAFDNDGPANEFENANAVMGGVFNPTLGQMIQSAHNILENEVVKVRSILDRLELFEEDLASAYRVEGLGIDTGGHDERRVFVVHGHDETAKQQIARTLEKLGLEAVILHEQPNKGATIIEKLVANSNVGFAVVLLTPDDVGARATDSKKLESRARENVIAELGYFIAKLGRDRVCPVVKAPCKPPSDFSGVVYVPMDEAGAWKFVLTKELRSAGYTVSADDL